MRRVCRQGRVVLKVVDDAGDDGVYCQCVVAVGNAGLKDDFSCGTGGGCGGMCLLGGMKAAESAILVLAGCQVIQNGGGRLVIQGNI